MRLKSQNVLHSFPRGYEEKREALLKLLEASGYEIPETLGF